MTKDIVYNNDNMDDDGKTETNICPAINTPQVRIPNTNTHPDTSGEKTMAGDDENSDINDQIKEWSKQFKEEEEKWDREESESAKGKEENQSITTGGITPPTQETRSDDTSRTITALTNRLKFTNSQIATFEKDVSENRGSFTKEEQKQNKYALTNLQRTRYELASKLQHLQESKSNNIEPLNNPIINEPEVDQEDTVPHNFGNNSQSDSEQEANTSDNKQHDESNADKKNDAQPDDDSNFTVIPGTARRVESERKDTSRASKVRDWFKKKLPTSEEVRNWLNEKPPEPEEDSEGWIKPTKPVETLTTLGKKTEQKFTDLKKRLRR